MDAERPDGGDINAPEQEESPEVAADTTDVPDEPEEKYSAQVLRRLHQDATILLEEYDEMRQHLEHEEIDDHLQEKLEKLVVEIEEIEALFEKHHPDAEPLEGAKDLEDDGDMEDDSDAVEADSSEEEEPSAEEALEGMETKRLKGGRKKALTKRYGKKGNLGIEDGHEPGYEELDKSIDHDGRAEGNDLGIEDGHEPGFEELEKDMGIEDGHEPGYEEFQDIGTPLEPHEKALVGEAADYLKDLSGAESHEWSDEHRMKSFHYHKSLDDISRGGVKCMKRLGRKSLKVGDKVHVANATGAGHSADGEVVMIEGGSNSRSHAGVTMYRVTLDDGRQGLYHESEVSKKSFPEIDKQDDAVEVTEKALDHDGRAEGNDLGIEDGHEPGFEELHEKGFPEVDEQDTMSEVTEEKDLHPHRQAAGEASEFFKDLSQTRHFGMEHAEKCLHHHKALDPIGHEVADDMGPEMVEPGDMGEKDMGIEDGHEPGYEEFDKAFPEVENQDDDVEVTEGKRLGRKAYPDEEKYKDRTIYRNIGTQGKWWVIYKSEDPDESIEGPFNSKEEAKQEIDKRVKSFKKSTASDSIKALKKSFIEQNKAMQIMAKKLQSIRL
jgi:ribosomal protein S15P/S13E